MGALGLNRSRFAFLSCYCDDTDPYVSRKKEQNPMLDIPALEFLKNVRLSECGVAILLCQRTTKTVRFVCVCAFWFSVFLSSIFHSFFLLFFILSVVLSLSLSLSLSSLSSSLSLPLSLPPLFISSFLFSTCSLLCWVVAGFSLGCFCDSRPCACEEGRLLLTDFQLCNLPR